MSAAESIKSWYEQRQLVDPLAEMKRLGLVRYATELDVHGFTVVPPELVAPPGLADELADALVRASERKSGISPDLETGLSHPDSPQGNGQLLNYLLVEDEAFERALMNEVVLAFAEYLCGSDCQLSSMSGIVKGPGNSALPLHNDTAFIPTPLSAFAHGVNCTWVLSDYDRENGALSFWPGSHRLCRRPTQAEGAAWDRLVPVQAAPGSLLVWHGNTWHSAFPRTAPGLRLNIILFFQRKYLTLIEDYRGRLSPEALARNNARFANLLQFDSPLPFQDDGQDVMRYARWGVDVFQRQEH